MESDIPMCIVIEEKVRSECSVREKNGFLLPLTFWSEKLILKRLNTEVTLLVQCHTVLFIADWFCVLTCHLMRGK